MRGNELKVISWRFRDFGNELGEGNLNKEQLTEVLGICYALAEKIEKELIPDLENEPCLPTSKANLKRKYTKKASVVNSTPVKMPAIPVHSSVGTLKQSNGSRSISILKNGKELIYLNNAPYIPLQKGNCTKCIFYNTNTCEKEIVDCYGPCMDNNWCGFKEAENSDLI